MELALQHRERDNANTYQFVEPRTPVAMIYLHRQNCRPALNVGNALRAIYKCRWTKQLERVNFVPTVYGLVKHACHQQQYWTLFDGLLEDSRAIR